MSLTTGCNVPFKVKSKFFCSFIFVDVFVTTFTCTYYFFHEASVPSVFNGIVGRVRNGFDTEEPLPYQLARSPGGCGAILISSRFAITANHCGWYVPWDSMAFVAGKYYKNMKPSDKNVQKRRVKKVYGNRPKNLEWHPDLVVVEFEEPLQARKCFGNYGVISEAVGELVKIRWYGQLKKPSPFKSGNRCVDPGCQQDNDPNADTCSKCGISLDLFKRPKIDDVRKADLFRELENSSAVSPTKNPNRAFIVLQQKVATLESTLKLTEQQLEEVQGQKTDIDADLERIIRLRAEMIDKKIPRKVIKKHDENENLPEVVKCYREIKDDNTIEPLIENVREAYDLYEFCARRLEQGSTKKMKPAIQQSQLQIVAQAAMALHLALMDYLEEFPVDKHRHVLMLIHQALRFKEKKSSDDVFDLSDLQKEIDDIIPKISNLAEPVNVYDTLRELSGSLTLIASVVTPEHDLAGFNGGLPTVKDLAKKAIKDCESVLKTHRESASANNFDQAYTLKLLYSVKNHVENDLKKYKVRFLTILDLFLLFLNILFLIFR